LIRLTTAIYGDQQANGSEADSDASLSNDAVKLKSRKNATVEAPEALTGLAFSISGYIYIRKLRAEIAGNPKQMSLETKKRMSAGFHTVSLFYLPPLSGDFRDSRYRISIQNVHPALVPGSRENWFDLSQG